MAGLARMFAHDAHPHNDAGVGWISDAGGVRTTRRHVDAMAGTPGQLAPGRGPRAESVRRGGQGDCTLRAGYGGGVAAPLCYRAKVVAGDSAARRTLARRCLDARCRSDIRRERAWRRARRALAL